MKNNHFFRILIALGIYLIIKYLVPDGRMLLYPINLLVTFLHEFGHAFGALITGGDVLRVQINTDGSGFAESVGGWRSIILMGGYIGSAVFGNLLLWIGAKRPQWANWTLYLLSSLMLFTGLFWFNSLFTSGLLLLFVLAFFLITRYTNFAADILLFLGIASIIYIIEDFNVGPSSDLAMYADTIPILPASGWMYVWLFIVLVISFFNARMLLRK